MNRAFGVAVAVVSSVGLLVALLLWADPRRPAAATAPVPVWKEVAWPFPNDPWGKGKAFRCTAADCGTQVTLYVRAKLGFCNCVTGIADDDDLDRMGDLFLVGDVSPVGPGHPVSIAWMKGRSRAYKLNSGGAPGKMAISVVYNERCDMIAATAVLGHDRPEAIEPGVIAFLNGSTVMRWAETTLGL
jgi:hypothetical protein